VADEVEEEASGVEAEAETEDHEDKVGDMEHDSDKPSETTDVQKDEEDSEKSDTSSSEKSNTSSSAKSDTGSKSDDAKKKIKEKIVTKKELSPME